MILYTSPILTLIRKDFSYKQDSIYLCEERLKDFFDIGDDGSLYAHGASKISFVFKTHKCKDCVTIKKLSDVMRNKMYLECGSDYCLKVNNKITPFHYSTYHLISEYLCRRKKIYACVYMHDIIEG